MNFFGSCDSATAAYGGGAGAFTLHELEYKTMQPYEEPSPIRISTISALAYLRSSSGGDGNIRIDLDRLYERLPLVQGDTLGVTDIKTYEKVTFRDGRKPEITQLHRQRAPTVSECFGKLAKNGRVLHILDSQGIKLD